MKRVFCFVLALTCWLGFSVISGSAAAPTAEGTSVTAESQTNPGMRNRRRQRRQWRRQRERRQWRRHYRRNHDRNRNNRPYNRPNR
jgi:hypothetical protein